MYTSNYRSSMLSLVVIILLHTQTNFSQSEEWTMFSHVKKKCYVQSVSTISANKNKRSNSFKLVLLLYLNFLVSWLKNLTLCNSAHFEPTTSFRSSVVFYKLHPTKVNSVNFKQSFLYKQMTGILLGLHVTSRRPCWRSRTKAFLSSGN